MWPPREVPGWSPHFLLLGPGTKETLATPPFKRFAPVAYGQGEKWQPGERRIYEASYMTMIRTEGAPRLVGFVDQQAADPQTRETPLGFSLMGPGAADISFLGFADWVERALEAPVAPPVTSPRELRVAIDFGTAEAPKVVVFYGGNDGVFRAINGNQSAAIGTAAAGNELWGFVPPEFYPHIKRIRDNTTQISFPNVTSAGAAPKPYGIDGPITAYRDTATTTVYATMRRGGRGLYAFDVTNSDPSDVTLKWRKGCLDNFPATGTVSESNCDTGLNGIGQTWSAAKAIKVFGYNNGTSPVIVMGGGYDTCEDRDPHACTSATKGNKVYVLDANTGAVLKALEKSPERRYQSVVNPCNGKLTSPSLNENSARIPIGAYRNTPNPTTFRFQ